MSIKISIKKNIKNKDIRNHVLFCDENFNISGLRNFISSSEFSYISDLLKTSDLKKNLLFFEINSKKTIFLVSIKKNLNTSEIESLGAKFHNYINYDKKKDYFIKMSIKISLKKGYSHRIANYYVYSNYL